MTRRLLLRMAPFFLVPQKPADLQAEFNTLANDFIADWNTLMGMEARGKWDRKLARMVEKDFERLTAHVGWVR